MKLLTQQGGVKMMITALAALACDVSYDFGNSSSAIATTLSATLTWWQVLPQPSQPNVYMSTATGTGPTPRLLLPWPTLTHPDPP